MSNASYEDIQGLNDGEYEALLNLILGSNKEIDDLLRQIKDEEKQKLMLEHFKDQVDSKFEE